MSDVVYGREKRIGVSVDAHADLLKERDALRAEVERLRAALTEMQLVKQKLIVRKNGTQWVQETYCREIPFVEEK